MVICLERGADLHTAWLMPLPLTVSCFSKIQIGFTFLVPADLGSPGKGPLNGCVCVCVCIHIGEVTSQNLRSRYDSHFVGITHSIMRGIKGAKIYRIVRIQTKSVWFKKMST